MVAISSRELAPRRGGSKSYNRYPAANAPMGELILTIMLLIVFCLLLGSRQYWGRTKVDVLKPGKRLLRVYIGAWIIALLFVGTHAGTALAVVYNGPYGYLDTEYRFDVISTFFLYFVLAAIIPVTVELAVRLKRCSRSYDAPAHDTYLRGGAWALFVLLAGIALGQFVPLMLWTSDEDDYGILMEFMEEKRDLRDTLGLVYTCVLWVGVVATYPIVHIGYQWADMAYRKDFSKLSILNVLVAIGVTTELGLAVGRLLSDDPLSARVEAFVGFFLFLAPVSIGLIIAVYIFRVEPKAKKNAAETEQPLTGGS